MDYTVNLVATMSGVSIRTLRYYDAIDLLKPAYVADNGYRYYKENELLLLQQILFFKELDFSLQQIKDIITGSDFNKLEALQAHSGVLQKRMERLTKLSETIDKTIKHLEGIQKMNTQELYWGFSQEKQKEHEAFLIQKFGSQAKELVKESHSKTKSWGKKEWDTYKAESAELYQQFSQLVEKKVAVDSDEVQRLVAQHHKLIAQFYDPTKEIYKGLADLYVTHPDLKAWFVVYHAGLPEFLAQAMKIFADKEL